MTQTSNETLLKGRAYRRRCLSSANRIEAIMCSATKLVLGNGYELATMHRVAAESGVSTRTIYKHYHNKAALFEAVARRLVDRVMAVRPPDVAQLEPRAALKLIANMLIAQAWELKAMALLLTLTARGARFPSPGVRFREAKHGRIGSALADYLWRETTCGRLRLSDPDRAALVFIHMILGEIHNGWQVDPGDARQALDAQTHIDQVIELFLNGTRPGKIELLTA